MELEKRHFGLEARVDGNKIIGVAMSYGETSMSYRERFEPGAFPEAERDKEIIANLFHDRTQPLARNGRGLKLTDSNKTLAYEISLPETPRAQEARELIKAGVITGASIEFYAVDYRFEGKGESTIRVISKARLVGLALTPRPAFKQTSAAVREEISKQERETRRSL